MKTDTVTEQATPTTTTDQPAPTAPKLEALQLPKGALLAFRQRGGAPARTRDIVLYPDGRVSFGGPDVSKEAYARVPRQLNDAQIARIRKTLERANFFRMASAQGEPPPDACAYEIIARAGNRVHAVSVFDSAIPNALQPLMQQLNALLPKE